MATVQQWWQWMGQPMHPTAQQVLMTADGGGSNGSRSRLWKVELQKFSDATGLEVHVCHFPPGPSKWNKIEHRLFCQITENWRGRPLVSQEVIVNLITRPRKRGCAWRQPWTPPHTRPAKKCRMKPWLRSTYTRLSSMAMIGTM